MNTCSTPDCGTDSGDLYLCAQCISDLDQWLDKGRAIVPEMGITIARLDNVRPTNNEGNNGTKSAGSAAPLNIGALELQMSLEIDLRFTAAEYAADPWSAEEAPRVIKDIRKAELMVSGPEDEAPTEHTIEQHREKLARHFPEPMPPSECATWLRENAGIKIHAGQINKWFHRGRINKQPGSTPKKPLYSAKEVLAAHMARQHEGS